MKFGTERFIQCSAARLDSNLVLQNWCIAPKKEELMRNSPFCITHDEKTTYSGQRWFVGPLMWGYICNSCVEKREEKKLVTMLTRSQRWIKEGENCFLPLLVPWPELGWPAILGPKFFLSKLTCVSLCFAFFPTAVHCYSDYECAATWHGKCEAGGSEAATIYICRGKGFPLSIILSRSVCPGWTKTNSLGGNQNSLFGLTGPESAGNGNPLSLSTTMVRPFQFAFNRHIVLLSLPFSKQHHRRVWNLTIQSTM